MPQSYFDFAKSSRTNVGKICKRNDGSGNYGIASNKKCDPKVGKEISSSQVQQEKRRQQDLKKQAKTKINSFIHKAKKQGKQIAWDKTGDMAIDMLLEMGVRRGLSTSTIMRSVDRVMESRAKGLRGDADKGYGYFPW